MITFVMGVILGSMVMLLVMALCIASGKASDIEEAMFEERKRPQVIFICDQQKETCRGGTPSCRRKDYEDDTCEYTSDVTHAAHFMQDEAGVWFETKEEERVCMSQSQQSHSASESHSE